MIDKQRDKEPKGEITLTLITKRAFSCTPLETLLDGFPHTTEHLRIRLRQVEVSIVLVR